MAWILESLCHAYLLICRTFHTAQPTHDSASPRREMLERAIPTPMRHRLCPLSPRIDRHASCVYTVHTVARGTHSEARDRLDRRSCPRGQVSCRPSIRTYSTMRYSNLATNDPRRRIVASRGKGVVVVVNQEAHLRIQIQIQDFPRTATMADDRTLNRSTGDTSIARASATLDRQAAPSSTLSLDALALGECHRDAFPAPVVWSLRAAR